MYISAYIFGFISTVKVSAFPVLTMAVEDRTKNYLRQLESLKDMKLEQNMDYTIDGECSGVNSLSNNVGYRNCHTCMNKTNTISESPVSNCNNPENSTSMESKLETNSGDMSELALSTTIHDLPTEILTNIFSFFSQKEIVEIICKVSSSWYQIGVSAPFWKKIKFDSVNRTVFDDIHVSLKRLSISNDQLKVILNKTQKYVFPNLSALKISTRFTWADMFGNFLSNCTILEEVDYTPDKKNDMELSLNCFSIVSLTKMKIGYFDSDIESFEDHLRAFVSSQPRLTKLVVSVWHEDNGLMMAEIIETSSSLRNIQIYNEFMRGSPFNTSSDALNLTEVVINAQSFSDIHVQCVAQRCKQLKVLNVETCLEITGKTLEFLGANCPLLEEIYIGDRQTFQGRGITGSAMAAFIEGCRKLTKVSFIKCDFINDTDVRNIVMSCVSLKMIRLRKCRLLTSNALVAIAENCQNLEIADFQRNKHMTYDCLVRLIQSCDKLKKLDLHACHFVSLLNTPEHTNNSLSEEKDEVQEWENNRDGLALENTVYNYSMKKLHINRCHNLSTDDAIHLVTLCPHLLTLGITCEEDTSENDFVRHFFETHPYLAKLRLSKKSNVFCRTDFIENGNN